jgi:hypothetical protein
MPGGYTVGMETRRALTPDMPVQYRLRLQGRVSADWSDWLDNTTVTFEGEGPGAVTVVTGIVRDQSALFGLLTFVRDLGVPLLSVEAIQWPASASNQYIKRRIAMKTNLIRLICNAVALGMGVAVVVLAVLGNLAAGTAYTLLGIGVTVLGLAGLQKE